MIVELIKKEYLESMQVNIQKEKDIQKNNIIFSDKKNDNFYSNPEVSAQTASKINRQILLESHILTKQGKEGEENKNTENIKSKN